MTGPATGPEESESVQMTEKCDMRLINIQALEPVEDSTALPLEAHTEEVKKSWMQQKERQRGMQSNGKMVAYMENCVANTKQNHGNAFFSAFLTAYNTHQDVLLTPDDVWLVICLEFSKYVNQHSESLHEKLVSHEGKTKLTVTTWRDTEECEWEEFFDLMKDQVSKNTRDGVAEVLQSNFSTTSWVDRMLSTAALMDSFKEFFSFGRCIPMCGIRNVCFRGTLEDWQEILSKTKALTSFDLPSNGYWAKYIEELLPVLQKLVETYQGHVDVEWWNRVMNLEKGRLGSGRTTYVTGWILKFFCLSKEKCDIGDIESYSTNLPVKIDNKLTAQQKTVYIVGGFSGLHAIEVAGRRAFRPQSSLLVWEDTASTDDVNLAKEHFMQEGEVVSGGTAGGNSGC